MTDGMPDRRILVIAGAGASVNLGADDMPLPMMSGWATELVAALGERATQIGITPDMPGEAFEKKLGQFLAFEQALPLVNGFGHMGTPGGSPGQSGDFQTWFRTASSAVKEIRQELWVNLWETFGRDRVDEAAARSAYGRLHKLIRAADEDGPESWIGYATTNYDTAIETAVEQDPNAVLVDGFKRRPGGGTEQYMPELLTSSIQDSTNAIAVIHLHGAVGWYLRGDGGISRQPADQRYDERRVPALLLPDDTKSPDTFDAPTTQTWGQFERLLGLSKYVLFLGHSLHDRHIVDAVRKRDIAAAAVIYTPPDATGAYGNPNAEEAQRCANALPGLVTIAGEFGQQQQWDDIDREALVTWLRRPTPTA